MAVEYGKLACVEGNVGTYFNGCQVVPKEVKKPFLLDPAVSIDLTSGSFDLAARAELIKKGQLIPLNDLLTMTEGGAKANIQTLPNKIEKFISDGLYKFMFDFEANICQIKSMRKLAKKKWQLLLLDAEDKLFFDAKNNQLNGFAINLMVVENESPNDGGSKFSSYQVWMQLTKDGTAGYNERRSYLVGSEYFDINGVQDVVLDKITTAHASFNVSVYAGCDGTTPVLGLVKEDFKLVKASDSSTVSLTTVTDNNDGTYTIASSATAGDYTLRLFDSVNNLAVVDIDNEQFFQSNTLAITLT